MNDALADKRDFIASPTDWTFSSGSPTSDTTSGIIDVSEWQTLSASGSSFFAGITEDSDFDAILNDVVSHWEDSDVTVYDRLRFYSLFEDEIDDLDSSSDAAELFADYQYSIDFEDVEYLSELTTAPTQRTGAAEGDTAVLMIHNRRTSNEVLGTGQHYTSGTTITLEQGTSAELSVWVRTDALEYGKDGQTTTPRSGAYIQVAQTVGGASLDNWTVSNIQTNGEWQEYKLYLRANSFAETTFTVTLGLGGGTSDDRYESVNGYAFFDDLVCTVISNEAYATKTSPQSKRRKLFPHVCARSVYGAGTAQLRQRQAQRFRRRDQRDFRQQDVQLQDQRQQNRRDDARRTAERGRAVQLRRPQIAR